MIQLTKEMVEQQLGIIHISFELLNTKSTVIDGSELSDHVINGKHEFGVLINEIDEKRFNFINKSDYIIKMINLYSKVFITLQSIHHHPNNPTRDINIFRYLNVGLGAFKTLDILLTGVVY